MDELELKERAGKFVYQLYSNNRKTLIELFEAAFTRMDDYKARAERAEAEAADLRAQLDAAQAAQEWRPVTEAPTETGAYLVGAPTDDPVKIAYYTTGDSTYDYYDNEPAWAGWWEGEGYDPIAEENIWFTHWRPLPAAPGDKGEEA